MFANRTQANAFDAFSHCLEFFAKYELLRIDFSEANISFYMNNMFPINILTLTSSESVCLELYFWIMTYRP